MKMVSYLSFDSPALLLLLLSVLTYFSMLRSSSVARLASEPKSCVNRFDKLKSVWFLLSRQTHLAFANSFWIIVFFKKLSRNFPLIRSLFTYQFADCFKCLSIFRYALSLSVESVLMYKSTLRSVLPRLRAYRKIYFALKFIWLNFYTMKFSRFRFDMVSNI